jgi:phenylalanyl-tRNA synthetase alpha chain
MDDLLQQIDSYKKEISEFFAEKDAAETFRIKYLGTKGLVKSVMAEMKNVPNEKKREFGQVLNEFKIFTENRYEELKQSTVHSPDATENNTIDLTLPGDELPLGSRHPISIVRNKIISIFQRLGFAVAEGPETILQGICRIRFTFPKIPTGCCVHTPAMCRYVKWKKAFCP